MGDKPDDMGCNCECSMGNDDDKEDDYEDGDKDDEDYGDDDKDDEDYGDKDDEDYEDGDKDDEDYGDKDDEDYGDYGDKDRVVRSWPIEGCSLNKHCFASAIKKQEGWEESSAKNLMCDAESGECVCKDGFFNNDDDAFNGCESTEEKDEEDYEDKEDCEGDDCEEKDDEDYEDKEDCEGDDCDDKDDYDDKEDCEGDDCEEKEPPSEEECQEICAMICEGKDDDKPDCDPENEDCDKPDDDKCDPEEDEDCEMPDDDKCDPEEDEDCEKPDDDKCDPEKEECEEDDEKPDDEEDEDEEEEEEEEEEEPPFNPDDCSEADVAAAEKITWVGNTARTLYTSNSGVFKLVNIPEGKTPDFSVRGGDYTGFMIFARKYCGAEFIDAVAAGDVTIDLFDTGNYYDYSSSFKRDDASRTQSTVMFTAKQGEGVEDKGNDKKDQLYLVVSGYGEITFKSDAESCFERMQIGVTEGTFEGDIGCVAWSKFIW